MCVAAIALGSNIPSRWGDRAATLREAIERVRALGEVRAVSSFHDTAPVGYTDQPRFLNGAMLIETELEPVELMHGLLAIEQAMGRDRSRVAPKGPRAIDLDLLLMDDSCSDNGRTDSAASGDGRAAFCSGAAGGDRPGDG